jgi:hypothetical protein
MPIRVRVEMMGWLIMRTDWDFPAIPHVCDPMISTRARVDASTDKVGADTAGAASANLLPHGGACPCRLIAGAPRRRRCRLGRAPAPAAPGAADGRPARSIHLSRTPTY